MSEEINWQYLPAETNLDQRIRETEAEHYREPRPSVVVHWGIDSRIKRLKAIRQDQIDNLHSMIEFGVCTCGLQILDELVVYPIALVTSPHHRNHITLEPEFPTFRGLVSKRLYSQGLEGNKIDVHWNIMVTRYVAGNYGDTKFIPSTFQAHRIPKLPDFKKDN